MKRLLLLLALFAGAAIPAFAQTPTLVQSVWGENSQAPDATHPFSTVPCGGTGSTLYYCMRFPEPTLANNLLVCETFGANSGSPTWAIADDHSQTWTKANASNFPFTSASGNIYNIWYVANAAAGVRQITFNSGTVPAGFFAAKCQEFYNVATTTPVDGTANCHTVTATTATGVATGTLTTGDLIVTSTDNDNATAIASFTAGSQANITWNLAAVDRLDGYAIQYGVYNSTTSFTPQLTTGTSQPFTTCQVAFKAASAGTAPTQAFRIVHLGHFAIGNTGTTTSFQFPSTGNLIVLSFTGGGDCISNSGNTGCATTAATTGVSSTPSNTWNGTGTVAGVGTNSATSQIVYAGNASTATTLSLSVTRNVNGAALAADNILAYDIVGAATSPFDNDSGGQTANQTALVSSLTTCSSCFSPGTVGDLVLMNANWNFGTSLSISAPAAALYDSIETNWNPVNGPEPVDQNGGWAHYYTASTSAISVTWPMANDGTSAQGWWAGRVAAFKPAAGGGGGVVRRRASVVNR